MTKQSNSTWQLYNGTIHQMRQQGKTLQEIGNTVGRTRERVRQILVEHYGEAGIKNPRILTSSQLTKLAKISRNGLYHLARLGIVKPLSGNNRVWKYDSIGKIREYYNSRRCHVCGTVLSRSQKSYCSDKCAKIGWYREEKKAIWRRFRRKKGLPITGSLAYIKKAGYNKN